MSYEGYEMLLCARGHYEMRDAHDYGDHDDCDECGAPIVWFCGVDQTNDAGVAPKLVEHEPAQTETCECCGHVKVIEEDRYCIPLNAGRLLKDYDGSEIPLEVPLVEVKFEDLNSGELFDTKDAAWANKR